MAIHSVETEDPDRRRNDYARHVAQLQRIMLSWDFGHVERCYKDGVPMVDDLEEVPNRFDSTEVDPRTTIGLP
jgi:hypothetical protein